MANTLRFKRGLATGIPNGALGEPLFTTDTFDLYIGNGTTNTRFQKYIASGTTSQLLRGDGSLLTMPIVLTSPANGQVLKYNGTSWVNDSDSGITGSGVAGQVAYFSGATTIGGGNNFFWDSSNNRLGLATIAPSYRLHIVGNGYLFGLTGGGTTRMAQLFSNTGGGLELGVDGSAGGTIFTNASAYASVIGSNNATPLQFATNATVRATLDTSGNLGLGVVPSAWNSPFKVIQIGASSSLWNISGVTGSSNNHYNDAANKYLANGFATIFQHWNGQFAWLTAPNNTSGAGAAITFTQAMTLTANGRLLLGTTTEGTQLLQVAGTMSVTGASTFGTTVTFNGSTIFNSGAVIRSDNGTAAAPAISFDSDLDTGIYRIAANTLGFSTLGTEKLRIANDGAATFSSTVTGASFIPRSSTIPTNGMYLPSTNSLGFATNSTLDMVLNESGNLGLKVTPSAWASGYDVIDIGARGAVYHTSGFFGYTNNSFWNGTNNIYKVNGFASDYYTQNGEHVWRTAPSGTAGNAITFTQAMIINASGATTFSSSVTAAQFRLSALNTAPATSSSTGTLGEIRIDADHIYVCTATNTWKRVAISTF